MKRHFREYFSHLCASRLRCQPQLAQERTAFAEGHKPKPQRSTISHGFEQRKGRKRNGQSSVK